MYNYTADKKKSILFYICLQIVPLNGAFIAM